MSPKGYSHPAGKVCGYCGASFTNAPNTARRHMESMHAGQPAFWKRKPAVRPSEGDKRP